LVERKQDAQTQCSQALQEQQITMKTLKEIAFFKSSLEQYSISTTNLSSHVNALNSAKDFGYNPVTIGENISRLTSIQEQYKVMIEMNDAVEKDNEKLAEQANELEKRVNELKKDKSRLEEMSSENARKFIGELTQASKKDIKEFSDFAIEKIRAVSENNDQTTDRAINLMKSVETGFQNILSQLKTVVMSGSDKQSRPQQGVKG
jgi:hypothetical protein